MLRVGTCRRAAAALGQRPDERALLLCCCAARPCCPNFRHGLNAARRHLAVAPPLPSGQRPDERALLLCCCAARPCCLTWQARAQCCALVPRLRAAAALGSAA